VETGGFLGLVSAAGASAESLSHFSSSNLTASTLYERTRPFALSALFSLLRGFQTSASTGIFLFHVYSTHMQAHFLE